MTICGGMWHVKRGLVYCIAVVIYGRLDSPVRGSKRFDSPLHLVGEEGACGVLDKQCGTQKEEMLDLV